MHSMKITKSRLVFLLLVFPFIRPLGLDEIRGFHYIFNAWLFIAMALILLRFVMLLSRKKIRMTAFTKAILIYSLWLIIDTLYLQHSIGAGLQKLFAAPCMCLLYEMEMQKDARNAIEGTIDLLLILETINLLLWSVDFNGYMFLGIRTALPLVGFLGIYVSLLGIYYEFKKYKVKALILIVEIIFGIFAQRVSTGMVAIAILLVFMLLTRLKKLDKIVRIASPYKLLIAGIIANVAVVFFQVQYYFSNLLVNILGESLALNGRQFIWERALLAIRQSPVLGYGVYGIYIQMPSTWSNNAAFNYVHTQSLQLLLDGGIILLVLFIISFIGLANDIRKANDTYIIQLTSIVMFCYLLMMIPEVCTNYLFCFAFFSLSANACRFQGNVIDQTKEDTRDRIAVARRQV